MKFMDKGISIAIPTYDSNGEGAEFVKFSLGQIKKQDFIDYEVIISDDSENDNIKKLSEKYSFVKYFKSTDFPLPGRNFAKGMTPNINRAISLCTKSIIQILFQDDFLRTKNTLKNIYDFYQNNDHEWAACCFYETKDGKTASRTAIPQYTERIYLGENTMSSPSIVSFRNKQQFHEHTFFDESLVMLMDCDWYKRMADKFGYPGTIEHYGIVIQQHAGQISNNQGAEPGLIQREIQYCKSKFEG